MLASDKKPQAQQPEEGLIVLKQLSGAPPADMAFNFSELIKNETTAERKPTIEIAEGTGGSGTSELTQEQPPVTSQKSPVEAEVNIHS